MTATLEPRQHPTDPNRKVLVLVIDGKNTTMYTDHNLANLHLTQLLKKFENKLK